MARPDDIPEDVWNTAMDLALEVAERGNYENAADLLARAIMAEREAQRERDAQISLALDIQAMGWMTRCDDPAQAGISEAKDAIAAAIRGAR